MTAGELVAGARALIDVPFQHQGRTKSGLDCLGMMLLVCAGFPFLKGLPTRADYGRYPAPLLREWISKICTPLEEPMPGALVLISFTGRDPNHVALCTGANLIHCSSMHRKVVEHGYRGAWLTQTDSLWWIPGVTHG